MGSGFALTGGPRGRTRVGTASTADEVALSSLQIRAIRLDPLYQGGDYYDTGSGPFEGLSLARGIGHFTYRTSEELISDLAVTIRRVKIL